MHKILENLSPESDITELLIFLKDTYPEVLEQSILSKEKDKSFFIHFSEGIQEKYDKIKLFYDLNKKYNYNFKNSFNKDLKEVNDLEVMLSNRRYNQKFLVECLNEFSTEEIIQMAKNTRLLRYSFAQNRTLILEELKKYPEIWQNENENKIIKENHLKSLFLSEIFYENTSQYDIEDFRTQCRVFLTQEIKSIEKYNIDNKLKNIVDFLSDMSKKEDVFTKEFKEELVGISLSSSNSKITNSILKTLFKEKLSTYEPDKPLWLYFKLLKNKDILYQFLENFKYTDSWEDKNGENHYKIDYLEKALGEMGVKLSISNYGTNNKDKRDRAISGNVLPLIEHYLLDEINGQIGFTREVLKDNSLFKVNAKINIPEDSEKIRKLLDKSLGYKINGELVVLKKIGFYINNLIGLEKIFEKDLLKNEELIVMLENFDTYNFSEGILNNLKEKLISKSLIINLEPLLEKNLKNKIWGENLKFFEELKVITNYNKMQKKFENMPENKKQSKGLKI